MKKSREEISNREVVAILIIAFILSVIISLLVVNISQPAINQKSLDTGQIVVRMAGSGDEFGEIKVDFAEEG